MSLPEVRIKTFDAYGDTVHFNEYKTQWGYTGITMVDVPAKKNAADSKSFEVLKQSWIYYNFDLPRRLRVTCIEGSRCKFPLAELIKGNDFESIGTGMKLISGAEHTEHVKNAIFWEINAYPLPTQEEIHRMDDRPTHRYYLGSDFLKSIGIKNASEVIIYDFGNKEALPDKETSIAMGIKCIELAYMLC
ncbi:hypothetical protein Tco_0465707 [Tanacetum coccineum]